MPRSKDNSAQIMLTTGCNLSCSYCYVTKIRNNIETMSDEIADRIMDFIDNQMPEGTRVHFFGGEPLLRYNTLKRIMNKYPAFQFSIVTNCTLLDEDKLEFFKTKTYSTTFLFSLDGTDKTQIKNRGMLPNYDIVVRAIKELHAEVRMMVEDPADMLDNVQFLSNLGVTSIKIGIPTFQVNKVGYKDEFIANVIKVKEKFPSIKFDPDRVCNDGKCFAFGGQRCFAPNGDIYPCDMFYHKKIFKIGNIDTGIDQSLIDKFLKDTEGKADRNVPCLAHKMFFGDKWINQ